ncbi:MAG: VWA domain-containing protein [Anaerolineae bacterium]|nr:VWA domain-containing protein [Anaerolineae bacterium]
MARLTDGVNQKRRRLKFALWLVTLIGVIIALGRPVFGVEAEIVETRGIAILVVLDVSNSMDAQDLQPSRIERAKLAIRDLMQGARGNQFGLVLFAGDAFVQFPLTSDVDTAMRFVDAASSGSISRQGTAIEDALRLALNTLDPRITSSSVIVLMSDGENHEGDPLAAAQLAAEQGVTIHVIGYGTPEGDVIPIIDRDGNVAGFRTDQAQNLVRTRLDEAILMAIAEATGGTYQRATDSGIELINLQNTIAGLETELLSTRFQTRNAQRFGILIALALITLTLEMLLSERNR